MSYFSERETGEPERTIEEIGKRAWAGVRAIIHARLGDGSFGASYPATCEDGLGAIGSDETSFWDAMRAEIPELGQRPWYGLTEDPPRSLDILDMVEFCWRCIGKPDRGAYHSFFDHYHLHYDVEAGRAEFREDINRIFRRNGLAYTLTEGGMIERLAAPILRDELATIHFATGDGELDRMLEVARLKFLNPDEDVRREALETLWDAWERLKTLGTGRGKREQITSLLDNVAGMQSPRFRDVLERDAKELTVIGNQFKIRHSELGQERLDRGAHVDYVFHRMLSLIQLILKTRSGI